MFGWLVRLSQSELWLNGASYDSILGCRGTDQQMVMFKFGGNCIGDNDREEKSLCFNGHFSR